LRYFIQLSYNGSAYHGWQIQPNANTVQDTIEKALSALLNTTISIVGAGRTDAGVHATEMFAHFDFDRDLNHEDLIYKLNSFLPKDIAIASIFEVKPESHARFNATQRAYHYKISTIKNVFDYDYSYGMHLPLDIEKMNAASRILLEYRDFQCFSKTNTDVKTYNCDIIVAFWKKENNQLIFTISADRFLRNMVRAIVGTLINIGLGKLKVDDLHTIIASKNRSKAGFSVPAQGLYLTEVKYPEDLKIK
jgi:tRNA pseudouridine38-40 synthase